MMNFGDGRVPDGRVLARLAEPGSILLPHKPARLMLEPVMSPSENRAALVPDNLLLVQKADAQKPVEHFAREYRGVPNVRDLQAGHELESVGPIGARVAGDRGFCVAGGAVLHVAGLRRARSRSTRLDRAIRNRARFHRADQ